jgi:hypothetical protein
MAAAVRAPDGNTFSFDHARLQIATKARRRRVLCQSSSSVVLTWSTDTPIPQSSREAGLQTDMATWSGSRAGDGGEERGDGGAQVGAGEVVGSGSGELVGQEAFDEGREIGRS